LDAVSEPAVMEALERLMKGMHDTLIALNGVYAEWHRLQSPEQDTIQV